MVDKNITQISEKDACVNEGKCESPQDKAVVDAGYVAIKTIRMVEGQRVSADEWNNDIMPAVRFAAENLPEDAGANEIARAAFPELFAQADKLKKEEQTHAAQDKAWESAQKLKAISKGAESGRQLAQTAKGLWGTVSSMFDGKTPQNTPPSKGRWGEVDKTGAVASEFGPPPTIDNNKEIEAASKAFDELVPADVSEAKEVEVLAGDVADSIPYTDAAGREYRFTGVASRTFLPEDNQMLTNPITYVAYKDPRQKAVIFEVVRNEDGSSHLQDTGVRVAGETVAIKASAELSGRWDGRVEFPPFWDATGENPFVDLEMVP